MSLNKETKLYHLVSLLFIVLLIEGWGWPSTLKITHFLSPIYTVLKKKQPKNPRRSGYDLFLSIDLVSKEEEKT